MAQARGNKAYVDLSLGIITEASPLDFPTNASSDELNMLFDKDERKRVKRPGLQITQGDWSLFGSASDEGYLGEALHWRKLDKYVLVFLFYTDLVGWSPKVIIHDPDAPYAPLSVLDLPLRTGSERPRVTVTEVQGNVAISIERGKPVLMVPRPDNLDIVDVYNINLYVRDFKLIDDNLDVSERPPTLTDEHEYNLINAGWHQARRIRGDGSNARRDPIEAFSDEISFVLTAEGDFTNTNQFVSHDNSLSFLEGRIGTPIVISGTSSNDGTKTINGYTASGPPATYIVTLSSTTAENNVEATFSSAEGYPSNADVAYLGMVPTSDGSKLEFDAEFLVDQTLGNTPAARGHYVYPTDNLTRSDKLLNRDADGAVENTLDLWGTMNL